MHKLESPELKPILVVFLMKASLIAFGASVTLLGMHPNLSLKSLSVWLIGVSAINLGGALIGMIRKHTDNSQA